MTVPAVDPLPHVDLAGADGDGGFSPARVVSVELTEALPAVPGGGPDQPGRGPYRRVLVLARLLTEPVGVCEAALPADGIAPDQLGRLLWRELRGPVTGRFEAAGLAAPAGLAAEGLKVGPGHVAVPARPLGGAGRRAVHQRCHLHPRPARADKEVPEPSRRSRSTRGTRWWWSTTPLRPMPCEALVEGLARRTGAEFRYCVEPRPGLSWARNAGIAAAASDIIAFLDDDDEPDEYWLAGSRGFAGGSASAAFPGWSCPPARQRG